MGGVGTAGFLFLGSWTQEMRNTSGPLDHTLLSPRAGPGWQLLFVKNVQAPSPAHTSPVLPGCLCLSPSSGGGQGIARLRMFTGCTSRTGRLWGGTWERVLQGEVGAQPSSGQVRGSQP